MGINERMKHNYEDRYRLYLTRRTPVIMRLDGRCFHTLTRLCNKPFDRFLKSKILTATIRLLSDISGVQCAYLQSDEVNILITDYENLNTEAWFDYNVQKMVSVSAGIMSAWFSHEFGKIAAFDSRVFNVPREEVCNYFISRQMDWFRNSLFMFANSFFSADELEGKGKADIHNMLHGIGENWAELPDKWKNGTLITKKCPDLVQKWEHGYLIEGDIIFTQDRNSIEKWVYPKEVTE